MGVRKGILPLSGLTAFIKALIAALWSANDTSLEWSNDVYLPSFVREHVRLFATVHHRCRFESKDVAFMHFAKKKPPC